MTMRLLSFAVWALVSATAVFWASRLLTQGAPAPAHAVTAGQSLVSASADLSRVLGSTRVDAPVAAVASAEPAVNARFKLVGVVASRGARPDSGLALIAVDGKAPKPIGLGGVVDGSLVLLAVNHRRAELGPSGGQATVTLDLPLAPEPNRAVRAPTVVPTPMPMPMPMPAPVAVPTPMPVPGAAPMPVPGAAPIMQAPLMPGAATAPPPGPPTPGGVPRTNAPETR
ncbi:MAG: hypothetical protein U1E89_05120 [Burkholderiaceae bacterium]